MKIKKAQGNSVIRKNKQIINITFDYNHDYLQHKTTTLDRSARLINDSSSKL